MPWTTFSNFLIAQAEEQQNGMGMWDLILQVAIILVIFYLLLIRPQQKRQKQHQNMLGDLQREQEVVTSGGIFGKIVGLTDTVVTLEVAPNVRVKVQRSQIAALKVDEAAVVKK